MNSLITLCTRYCEDTWVQKTHEEKVVDMISMRSWIADVVGGGGKGELRRRLAVGGLSVKSQSGVSMTLTPRLFETRNRTQNYQGGDEQQRSCFEERDRGPVNFFVQRIQFKNQWRSSGPH